MASPLQFIGQVFQGFSALPPAKRISVVVTAILSFVVIGAFVVMMNQKDYGILYSNLSTDDAGKIVARLQDKKIPYKLSPTGDSVLVPSENVAELRLDLASAGLPQGGAVGFEIFDEKNFGVTDFVQQLNYQRALQGELARTINNLEAVEASRVHIVIPKKSLFVENETKPTASVFLRLRNGSRLGDSQIEGISYLVASSIGDLNPENVTIVDSRGRVLSKQQAESQLSRRTSSQAEYQRNVESELANRIQSMLTKVVGSDNVVARVTASLDFSVREKTEEIYDAEEPALRSRHRKIERFAAPQSIGGQSSVAPMESAGVIGGGSQREKTDEVVNYEVNRVVNKTMMPVGTIEKLSVAVLVDGTYVKNDKGVEEFQPRSKKEMGALEELVKNCVGFDSRRGDQVVVTSIPFKTVDAGQALMVEDSWKSKIALFLPMVKYLISLAAILFIALFVLRPMVKSLMERGGEHSVRQQRELTAAGMNEQLSVGMGSLSLEGPQNDINAEVQAVKRLAGSDDQGFAELMRNWLK
jgi:flagellar M-ring protein FliF